MIKESAVLRYVRLLQPEPRLWSRTRGALPDFLIIGAQRSGSTFLHDYLSLNTTAQSSPLQKELHFFDNKYYKGLDWYAKFFEPIEEESSKVKNFEASPYYLYHPAVPKRIRESLSDVRAVAVLRDPVDRAISQYKWIRQVGLETRGAVEAFEYDAERLEWETDQGHLGKFGNPLYFDFDHIHRGYLRRSLYHLQIERWLRHFPASQMRVLSSDRLFSDPESVVDKLSAFLGIEHHRTGGKSEINQNSSQHDIHVSLEARRIASRHLADVGDKVRDLLPEASIIGGELSF